MSAKNPPDGYHTVTPSLTIKGAAAAIEFYKRAFDAVEIERMADADGAVMHAEMRIGDSLIMLADEFPDWGMLGPISVGGTSTSLRLFIADVDAMTAQAVAAGATLVQPPTDQFWGDRSSMVLDPFGHRWGLATHVEDVAPEEMSRRAAKWIKENG